MKGVCMTDNVVQFPIHAIKSIENALSEPDKQDLQMNKQRYLDASVDQIGVALMNSFAMIGINVFDQKCGEDFSIVMEMIRCAMYRNVDIDHPLHSLMDDMYENQAGYFGDEELPDYFDEEFEEYLQNEEEDPDFT